MIQQIDSANRWKNTRTVRTRPCYCSVLLCYFFASWHKSTVFFAFCCENWHISWMNIPCKLNGWSNILFNGISRYLGANFELLLLCSFYVWASGRCYFLRFFQLWVTLIQHLCPMDSQCKAVLTLHQQRFPISSCIIDDSDVMQWHNFSDEPWRHHQRGVSSNSKNWEDLWLVPGGILASDWSPFCYLD